MGETYRRTGQRTDDEETTTKGDGARTMKDEARYRADTLRRNCDWDAATTRSNKTTQHEESRDVGGNRSDQLNHTKQDQTLRSETQGRS